MGAALPYLAVGGQVMGAIQGYQGAKYQAKAASNAANYNAALERNNAIIARNNKNLSSQEGTAATEAAQLETRAKVGAIKAQQGASGVDLNYGSAPDVRSSAAATGQLSAINIRANAARKAYGYEQQAVNDEAQAGLYDAQAVNEKRAGDMNASTTLLGGLSDAGMGWNEYTRSKSVS